MEALDNNCIETVATQVLSMNNSLHPTSIAMLQTLLRPYAESLVHFNNIQDMTDWIRQTFPGQLARYAESEMLKEVTKVSVDKRIPAPAVLAVGKNAVIEYLLAELVDISGTKLDGRKIVTPWDVQATIMSDEEFSQLFQYQTNTLPVSITLNGQQFILQMSKDQALGLLLFSVISDANIQLSMFGAPLTEDLIENFDTSSHIYSLNVGTQNYGFNTPEFMQGFQTGANWAGVDHHRYWSNLTKITKDNQGNFNEISITF